MSAAPTRDPNAVYLVDGNYWIRRFFHAIQKPILNKSGQDVGAVSALRDLLINRLRGQFTPRDVVAVFDGDGSCSGRKALLPSYKASRQSRPESLDAQITLAIEHLPRYGVQSVMIPDVEADDIIVQLAHDLRAGGYSIFIVSGDKDFAPYVRDEYPPVALYAKGTDDAWAVSREDDVRQRYGVDPGKLLDVFALSGDKSDGVPGLEGVGPKKAADLIREYGSLDALLSLIPTVRSDVVRERLREHADDVRLYRRVLEPIPIPFSTILAHSRRQPTAGSGGSEGT